jgi:hypothetical protein
VTNIPEQGCAIIPPDDAQLAHVAERDRRARWNFSFAKETLRIVLQIKKASKF